MPIQFAIPCLSLATGDVSATKQVKHEPAWRWWCTVMSSNSWITMCSNIGWRHIEQLCDCIRPRAQWVSENANIITLIECLTQGRQPPALQPVLEFHSWTLAKHRRQQVFIMNSCHVKWHHAAYCIISTESGGWRWGDINIRSGRVKFKCVDTWSVHHIRETSGIQRFDESAHCCCQNPESNNLKHALKTSL